MAKRSPYEGYYKRQRQIDSKVFDIMLSTKHMCLCNHPQGLSMAKLTYPLVAR